MTVFEYTLNIILIIAVYYYFRKGLLNNTIVVILVSSSYIMCLGIYFSLFLIENGVFVSEQNIMGFANYASVILLLYLLLLNYMVDKEKHLKQVIKRFQFSRRLFEYNIPHSRMFFYSIIVLLIFNYYIIYILDYGFGADRFNPYGSLSFRTILFKINIIYSVLIPYLIVRINKRFRKRLILLIIINSIVVMSTTATFLQLVLPLGILFVLNKNNFQFSNLKKKIILKYVIIFVLLIILGLVKKYLSYSGDNFYNLYLRYVVQGQLFWGSINHSAEANLISQANNFWEHAFEIKGFYISLDYGFGYLMKFISGDIAVRYIETMGIRMTSGMPAILIVNFGIILSFIIYSIIFKLYLFFLKYYLYSLLYENVTLFIIIAIVSSSINDFMLMGEYGHFNLLFVSFVFLYMGLRHIFKILSNKSPHVLDNSFNS